MQSILTQEYCADTQTIATRARVPVAQGKVGYTRAVFHFPRLKSTALTTASIEYATASATKTPVASSPPACDSTHARGSSSTQNTSRLIHVGVHVSPAPLNDCVSTMPYA